VSAQARVYAIVAAAAAVVAGATVGVVLLQTRGETTRAAGAVTKPRPGAPPLLFDFGLRQDDESAALTRGATLLASGRRRQAAAIFDRYHSLEAQIGAAFARWPDDGLDTLKGLVASHPQSAVAELHLGLALFWSGRVADAVTTLERVDTSFPDAPEAVEAENILYAKDAQNLPFLVLPIGLPSAPTLAAQVRLLARRARRPDAAAKLRYGLVLWNLRRRVSAERQFEAAAALAPHDPVARTAAAVGVFTKRAPVRAFARLGPLTGAFPHASVVRFHLGVLLLWTGRVKQGIGQLRLAMAEQPRSLYAKEARRLLSKLPNSGTK
jgi:tetratricopeptide (TPR) repeat protein